MRGIVKTFGAVHANDAIDLQIQRGEVLALLGENGAGKSTLMKILYGYYQADAGSIDIDQQPRLMHSPKTALECGIGMVFQQFTLIPALTVWENLLLAYPHTPWWPARRHPALHTVLHNLNTLAPQLDPKRRIRDLSIGEQQLVELAKVMNLDARVLILDEPTAVLTPAETERLYEFIRSYSATGRSVVLITHKLADVRACADRIVVLRGGRVADERSAQPFDSEALITAMVGTGKSIAAHANIPLSPATATATPRLVVKNLSASAPSGTIDAVSFSVAQGEILGIAGVAGNGQHTLAATLAGLIGAAAGEVLLDGEAIQLRPQQLAKVRADIAYIPE
jgi:simple sugar transport system ATP-binding protein